MFNCAPADFFLLQLLKFLSPPSCLLDLGSLSWDDLENDLPDELIPNGGDLNLMGGIPTNGGAAPGTVGPGGLPVVPDAAAKHKQLSELLRAGSTSSITGTGLNSSSPQPGGMGPQLGTPLGKSPLSQGSPNNRTSPQAQKAGTPTGMAGQNNNNNNTTMGLNTSGFNQTMINNSQGHAGLLAQGAPSQPGPVLNGGLGPGTGRGRGVGVAGIQYPGTTPGAAGTALAETLNQGGQQMGTLATLNAAQPAGNMNKVSQIVSYGLCDFNVSIRLLFLMKLHSKYSQLLLL